MPNASMREIFLEFAKYVLDDSNNKPTGFPAYDLFYRYFEQQIEKYRIPQPATVSWLTSQERTNAIRELTNNPVFDISLMSEPTLIDETHYPTVNYSHFG